VGEEGAGGVTVVIVVVAGVGGSRRRADLERREPSAARRELAASRSSSSSRREPADGEEGGFGTRTSSWRELAAGGRGKGYIQTYITSTHYRIMNIKSNCDQHLDKLFITE